MADEVNTVTYNSTYFITTERVENVGRQVIQFSGTVGSSQIGDNNSLHQCDDTYNGFRDENVELRQRIDQVEKDNFFLRERLEKIEQSVSELKKYVEWPTVISNIDNEVGGRDDITEEGRESPSPERGKEQDAMDKQQEITEGMLINSKTQRDITEEIIGSCRLFTPKENNVKGTVTKDAQLHKLMNSDLTYITIDVYNTRMWWTEKVFHLSVPCSMIMKEIQNLIEVKMGKECFIYEMVSNSVKKKILNLNHSCNYYDMQHGDQIYFY